MSEVICLSVIKGHQGITPCALAVADLFLWLGLLLENLLENVLCVADRWCSTMGGHPDEFKGAPFDERGTAFYLGTILWYVHACPRREYILTNSSQCIPFLPFRRRDLRDRCY